MVGYVIYVFTRCLLVVVFLTRGGFGQEMKNVVIYERFNPSFKDINDLRDIFYLLFSDKNDARWIDAVPLKTWRGVFGVLTRYTEQKDRERLKNHIESEGLFAIEMLQFGLQLRIWILS